MTTFKTGNPVPSMAAKDLYDNAQNLDEAINGPANRWVDRTGRSRVSITGALAALDDTMTTVQDEAHAVLEGLGYLIPVPYAAGLAVDSSRFTVTVGADTFAANPASLPFVTRAVFDPAQWRVIQGITAGTLGSAVGSSLVGYRAPGLSAALVDVARMLDQAVTVDNYRLPEDADDGPSFLRMHEAVGEIRLSLRTYEIPGGLSVVDEEVRIVGAGRAVTSEDGKAFVDGTGSIIVSAAQLRADVIEMRDLCFDVGDSRGFSTNQEGIVADARVGTNGKFARIRNVGSMGPTTAVSSHALLVEGFDRFEIEDVVEYHHNYGVVVKSRNGFIRKIASTDIKTAAVYVKASAPASAGGVLSGRVDNVQISGVKAYGDAATSIGVWIHAEGDAVTRVTVSDLMHTGGRCGLRVSADGAHYVSDAKASEISVDSATLGWELFGNNYEVKVKSATVTNPTSAQFCQTDDASLGWNFSGISLVITDTSAITGASVARLLGTGMWDDLDVRNDARNMAISHDMGSVRGGKKRGSVLYSGEGSLVPALKNGFAPAPDEMPPSIAVGADNTLHVTGTVTAVSSTAPEILELMGTLSFGLNRRFSVAGMKTDLSYVPVTIVASGNKLTLEAPAERSTLSKIDLSGVVIRR